MSEFMDAWIELNQGGRLLDRRGIESLPEPRPASRWTIDRVRDALTAALAGRATTGERLSDLLDAALEKACGLREGWRKGAKVGAADAERLLDGTELKPRRLLELGGRVALAVFTSSDERIGLRKGRRVVSHVVEWLRRRSAHFALLTNGREWRLIFADADNLAWVEWAADRWLEGDSFSPALELLRRILSPESLAPDGAGSSLLLAAVRRARKGQSQLSQELGERVRAAVELLLRARRPVIEPAWNEADARIIYNAACRYVMRLVVVLFAEARELMPVDNPVYHQAYGLRGLIESLDRASAERRRSSRSAWPRLLALFRLLHAGSLHPQIVVPAYGGDLFRAGQEDGDALQRALALIESTQEPPDDDVVHRVLVLLTRTTERVREGAGFRNVAAPVDFTELTSEYIGILYEGLLDYELHRAGDEPIIFLGLGDQPALPLDRLESMSDAQLDALVKKAKVKRKAAMSEDEDEGDEGDDEESDEEPEADDSDEEQEQEDAPQAAIVELPPDDARLEAVKRARTWAERAAVAGKIVRAPRRRSGRDDPAWRAEVESAAKQLVVDVKLPGELYLVRWGGTRKGAGTFYTKPQLTLPTVRRTLDPLLVDDVGRIRRPEEILSLKVCDPAMGSGSFLVASIRVLTDAVVRSLHEHGRVAANKDIVRIECSMLPEADRDQPEDQVEAIVRRAVVEQCIYGVDLDPLAVELARVSLWVETLDRRLPFTFLDHKLRCGDALLGTWLDRFRDYPLLAWWRQSPDEKWRGVTHAADEWAKALKKRRQRLVAEQVELITGQRNLLAPAVSDDELRRAVARVRELHRRLHDVPATQPDRRAEIWREKIAPDPALARVREAFDTWCALWFWPLDRLDEAPGPATLAVPSEEAIEIVRALRERLQFFHWELEFPDVFTEPGAGFDAVVANPPWEIRKPNSKEFFSDRDPLYRAYGKQEGLARQREEFAADAAFERRWLDYKGSFKDAGNFVRNAAEPFGDAEDAQGKSLVGLVPRRPDETRKLHQRWATTRARRTCFSDPKHPFRHQGSADLNSYKMFVEQAHALLRTGGQIGILVPSGLYTDKGSSSLRRLLLEHCTWRWLYGFENRDKIFDIHRSFKFAPTIARKGGVTESVQAAFMRHDADDWTDAKGALAYPAERIRAFSPRSLALLEIGTERDLEVLTKMYASSVLLGDDGPDGWGVKFATEFHMTNDSKIFIPRKKAEDEGYEPDEYGRWIGSDGEVLLPLYQGSMIHQHDFAYKGWLAVDGRAPNWCPTPWPSKRLVPKYLVRASDYTREAAAKKRRCGFRDIARTTDQRTMIAAFLPDYPCGNKVPFLTTADDSWVPALTGLLNSLVYDWVQRTRQGSASVNFFVLAENPLIKPVEGQILATGCRMLGQASTVFSVEWLTTRTEDGARRWRQVWAVTAHERLRLRCVLDALVAARYGLSRDDLRWVLRDCDHPREHLSNKSFCRALDAKGFWRVGKDLDPELRHAVLSLVAFDALNKLIAEYGGDRDRAVTAFTALNGGEGWMLPETLRLADHDLGHDERAREPQPVASRLGPRFLDWQLAQTPEESWAECERHARVILGGEKPERPPTSGCRADAGNARDGKAEAKKKAGTSTPPPQLKLFETKPGKQRR